jgi:hypothetical protein
MPCSRLISIVPEEWEIIGKCGEENLGRARVGKLEPGMGWQMGWSGGGCGEKGEFAGDIWGRRTARGNFPGQ